MSEERVRQRSCGCLKTLTPSWSPVNAAECGRRSSRMKWRCSGNSPPPRMYARCRPGRSRAVGVWSPWWLETSSRGSRLSRYRCAGDALPWCFTTLGDRHRPLSPGNTPPLCELLELHHIIITNIIITITTILLLPGRYDTTSFVCVYTCHKLWNNHIIYNTGPIVGSTSGCGIIWRENYEINFIWIILFIIMLSFYSNCFI